MARSYGAIICAIWDDPEFCALSSDAQRTYLMLVTQPDISACGSLPLTLRRWSKTLPERDRNRLQPSLDELGEHRFILIDADTEELLVRTFPKHDGGYKHSKRVLAVIGFAEAIRSQSLRNAVAVELDKLGVKTAIQVLPDRDSIGNEQVIDSGRSVVTLGELEPHSTIQEPHSAIPNREPSRERCKREHPPDQNCHHCGQDRLADEAVAVAKEAAKRAALHRNDSGMAELNADLAKPMNKRAFVAAREVFQATLESRPA